VSERTRVPAAVTARRVPVDLGRALARFKATCDAGAVPGYRGSVRAFEDLMGYRELAERARTVVVTVLGEA